MKKLLFFALVFLTLASCKTDEPKVFKIDPMATIAIKPDMKAFKRSVMKAKAENGHLSALEIVKQTDVMTFTFEGRLLTRGFAPDQRDTISEIPMLKMWGTDILYYTQLIDGTYTDNLVLEPSFLGAENCILKNNIGDTIAFIPNNILRAAETQIKTLFADKNYEPIYGIFNDAYTFTPITGAEWRALQK